MYTYTDTNIDLTFFGTDSLFLMNFLFGNNLNLQNSAKMLQRILTHQASLSPIKSFDFNLEIISKLIKQHCYITLNSGLHLNFTSFSINNRFLL